MFENTCPKSHGFLKAIVVVNELDMPVTLSSVQLVIIAKSNHNIKH
jgi:hypothetical protein